MSGPMNRYHVVKVGKVYRVFDLDTGRPVAGLPTYRRRREAERVASQLERR